MKKLLWIGSILLILGLLIGGSAGTMFAHGPDDGEEAPANEDAWEAMHEACEIGDWQAMHEAAEEAHGENFDDMPCHGEGYDKEGPNPVSWPGWLGWSHGRRHDALVIGFMNDIR